MHETNQKDFTDRWWFLLLLVLVAGILAIFAN